MAVLRMTPRMKPGKSLPGACCAGHHCRESLRTILTAACAAVPATLTAGIAGAGARTGTAGAARTAGPSGGVAHALHTGAGVETELGRAAVIRRSLTSPTDIHRVAGVSERGTRTNSRAGTRSGTGCRSRIRTPERRAGGRRGIPMWARPAQHRDVPPTALVIRRGRTPSIAPLRSGLAEVLLGARLGGLLIRELLFRSGAGFRRCKRKYEQGGQRGSQTEPRNVLDTHNALHANHRAH